MSLATYADLQASIASWATRSDLTGQIPDFVTWAQQEISRRLRSRVMLVRGDLSISGEFIDQPDGFLAFQSLYLDTSPRVKVETTSAEIMMELTTDFGSSQYPANVALIGSELWFGPQFTWTGTGKALYFAEPTAMVDDADTNAVLTKYPFTYLYGALEALYRYLEDDDNANLYGGMFGALIDDINVKEAKDNLRGPISPQPMGGVPV